MRLRVPKLMAAEVTGESMLPLLRPGDRLIVRAGAPIRTGDVVVARHPGHDLLIVKRVGHRDGAGWWLESDNQRASGRQDSWDFGAVADGLVTGRVVGRYWPPSRVSFSGFSGSRSSSAPSRRRAR